MRGRSCRLQEDATADRNNRLRQVLEVLDRSHHGLTLLDAHFDILELRWQRALGLHPRRIDRGDETDPLGDVNSALSLASEWRKLIGPSGAS